MTEKTLLSPLFKLADEGTWVKMEVDVTLDVCEAEVIGESHEEAYFSRLVQ